MTKHFCAKLQNIVERIIMPKYARDAKEFTLKVFHDGTAYRITVPKVWVDRIKKQEQVSFGTFIFDGNVLKINIADEK